MSSNREDQASESLHIERQVERLGSIADPAARAAATDLVASVLELHRCALERMLAIVKQNGSAAAVFAAFEQDELVRSVLLLHDLDRRGIGERVVEMLAELRPKMEKFGAVAEVIQADENAVRVRVSGMEGGCGSTAETVRSFVEASLIGIAPDAAEITVELAVVDKTFVPINSIRPAAVSFEPAAAKS
ncbi:MAG TPA: NifU family protein [Verrucomicrobiae bacterium]|nr:NifU family protein [Verrucomicrobiae bacterium]